MDCSADVIINKPIQQVWDYTNNPDNLKLWLDDFVRYEHLTGDIKAPKIGDTSAHTYDENGKEFTMQEEIVAYNPPHHITLNLTHKMFDMRIVNDLEAIDANQTKLTATAETIRAGLVMKVMMFFMSSAKMQTKHEAQIERLKDLIEAT